MLMWSLLLAVVLVLTVVGNLLTIGYVKASRERDPRMYLEAADQLRRRHDITGALEQLDEAFRLAPNSPLAYKVSGDLHYQLKQWDRAVEAYKRAIELGSTDQGVRTNTVWSLIEMAQYEQAVEFGRLCIAQGYGHVTLVRYVGEAYFRAGDHAAAIPFLEKVLEKNPNDLYIMERLRQAYKATGNHEQAKATEVRIADIEATIDSLAAGSS